MRALSLTVSLAAFSALIGCSTISTYDQAAYEHATDAKVDALALMGKATGDYGAHEGEIAAVQLELEKAYEYDKGRPLNEITLKQWDLLLSPEHDLFGGFLRDWKRKGQFKPIALAERKQQVAKGFDQIIGLESGKLKPADVQP
jgi:hypothetical protein